MYLSQFLSKIETADVTLLAKNRSARNNAFLGRIQQETWMCSENADLLGFCVWGLYS